MNSVDTKNALEQGNTNRLEQDNNVNSDPSQFTSAETRQKQASVSLASQFDAPVPQPAKQPTNSAQMMYTSIMMKLKRLKGLIYRFMNMK